ncbi:restriction endonuclease subunit S [Lactobacillus helveticus]|uniref:restriction endonuclease subunit S n=1 Tax=Lactobacillus helveticus TaxID=1587 RepID=UPI00197B6691|nr:restriction endonuclease subunit S [Lactobacillus helveticus]MBN6049194.1 restriction endonuclease subunit S [Lactobacillus helveticus]
MAKIDDSVKKKVPELRFKGFTDDWEQRKLGQYTKLITKGTTPKDKTGVGDVNFIKVENITNGKIYPINKIKQNEHDNYLKRSRLEEKDILFSIAGTLGRTAIVNKSILPANTNQALAIIRGYDFDTNFLITSLAGNVVKEYIRRNPTVGAQPNLSLEQVGNLLVNTPNAEEQQKIGSFFKQLDLLKEQKKGFLQKMFPKNGSRVPELRFEGFSDDWEERKLGEFSDVRDGTHASPKYVSQGHPMVTSKNLTHSGLDMTDVSFLTDEDFNEINKRSKVSIGDILFGMIGTIGNPVIVDRDDFAIKNVALIKEKTSNPITNKWLLQYLKSPSFNRFIQKENAGGTQKFIALGLIRDMKLRVPEFDEQQKIGSFFQQLDNTITLHQRKLEKLQELKKGYLQKMFC